MRELEGRSYADIADTIGVSVSAVETLIFRGRKSLRLKASALRALAAVPLPNSLTQLIEGGGGVVAGGGAVVGTGFLLKAAAALVAGAVATGLAVGHSRPTVGAAGSTPRFASGEPSPRADGFTARPSSLTVKRGQIAPRDRVRKGSANTSAGRAAQVGGPQAVPTRPQAPAGSADAQTSSSAGASPVPSQVAGLPNTTEKAAEAALPALSVQGPGLPPVPVDVPKIPGTPLPVQVPSLPPVPVVVPKLPGGTPLP